MPEDGYKAPPLQSGLDLDVVATQLLDRDWVRATQVALFLQGAWAPD